MKRAVLFVGVTAAALAIFLIVFAASFRLHLYFGGASGGVPDGWDVDGLLLTHDTSKCVMGPVALVQVWLGSSRLVDRQGSVSSFSVTRLGARRSGWTDADDADLEALRVVLAGTGWACGMVPGYRPSPMRRPGRHDY